jgi:predicted phosphohydrolase
MKVKVISDVHVEFYNDPEILCKKLDKLYPRVSKDEILVIAGDMGVAGSSIGSKKLNISKGLNPEYKYLLRYFAKRWNTVILVAGNHEFYDRCPGESLQDICNMIEEYCIELGIFFLNRDIIETDGYIFVGTTLWSEATPESYENMNDKQQAIVSYEELIKTHKEDVKWLDATLNKIKKVEGKEVIVITHHLPLKELMHEKYQAEEYLITNPSYASDLTKLVKKHSPLINYWFYGHVHENSDKTLHDVNFVGNPLGYPEEEKKTTVMNLGINFKLPSPKRLKNNS